jgi:hypothetical protein
MTGNGTAVGMLALDGIGVIDLLILIAFFAWITVTGILETRNRQPAHEPGAEEPVRTKEPRKRRPARERPQWTRLARLGTGFRQIGRTAGRWYERASEASTRAAERMRRRMHVPEETMPWTPREGPGLGPTEHHNDQESRSAADREPERQARAS